MQTVSSPPLAERRWIGRMLWAAALSCGVLCSNLLSAQSGDPKPLREALRLHFRGAGNSPTAQQLAEWAKQGDIFEAALELFREVERDSHTGNEGATGEFGGAMKHVLTMMRTLGEDVGEPRVAAVFLDYLRKPPADPLCVNYPRPCARWTEGCTYVIKTQNPEGEKLIKTFLEDPGYRNHPSGWDYHGELIGDIYNCGGAHWLPYLREYRYKIGRENEELQHCVERAILNIQQRFPESQRNLALPSGPVGLASRVPDAPAAEKLPSSVKDSMRPEGPPPPGKAEVSVSRSGLFLAAALGTSLLVALIFILLRKPSREKL